MLIPIAIYLAKYAGWPRNAINRRIVYGIVGVPAARRRARGHLAHRGRRDRRDVPRHARVPPAAGGTALRVRPATAHRSGRSSLPKVVNELIGSFLDVDSLVASQYTSAGWTAPAASPTSSPRCARQRACPFFGTGLGSADRDRRRGRTPTSSTTRCSARCSRPARSAWSDSRCSCSCPRSCCSCSRSARARTARHAQLAFTIAVSIVGLHRRAVLLRRVRVHADLLPALHAARRRRLAAHRRADGGRRARTRQTIRATQVPVRAVAVAS